MISYHRKWSIIICICMCAIACSSQSPASKPIDKKNAGSQIKARNSYAVYFTNNSNLPRPAFVRMPLLARIEFNIFITHSPLFHQVNLDQTSDFFYSGDMHIPYILSTDDTISINMGTTKDNLVYNLSSGNQQNQTRIIIFQEAIKKGIPLYYTELDNQQHKLLVKQRLLNNLSEIIKINQSAVAFAETFCKNMEREFKDYFKEYIKFDHYIKIFTYCPDRKIIDSLFKTKYFDFTTDHSNKYIQCNFAYFGALYQSFIYRYNNNPRNDAPLKAMAFIDANFNKKESDLIKLFYLKTYGIKLIAESPAIFDNALKEISDTNFKHYLSAVADNFRYQKNVKDKVVSSGGKTLSIDNIIKAPSRTIKYIDFWASWCGSCRAEFSNYPNLLRTFSKDEIEFITISLDQDVTSWKKALLQEHLDPRFAHYFYPNPTKENITALKLESIPRYSIVNQNGIVLYKDAPRPSDSTLIPLLQKLLKENTKEKSN